MPGPSNNKKPGNYCNVAPSPRRTSASHTHLLLVQAGARPRAVTGLPHARRAAGLKLRRGMPVQRGSGRVKVMSVLAKAPRRARTAQNEFGGESAGCRHAGHIGRTVTSSRLLNRRPIASDRTSLGGGRPGVPSDLLLDGRVMRKSLVLAVAVTLLISVV